MSFPRVLGTELIKLKRCKVTWISWIAYSFIVLVCGLFMWIMKDPETAGRLGLIGQKARFSVGAQTASWSTLMAMLEQTSGVGGMIVLSVIVTYIFGREYAEGMGKYMLSLPLRRSVIVIAKLTTALAWFGVLCLSLVAEGLLIGAALGLEGFSWALFAASALRILFISGLFTALAPAVAWVAVGSGGYLAPLGYSIFTVVLGTVFGATDWAPYCPWSIVPLLSGVAGPGSAQLRTGSALVLCATFLVGAFGVIAHLASADNAQ